MEDKREYPLDFNDYAFLSINNEIITFSHEKTSGQYMFMPEQLMPSASLIYDKVIEGQAHPTMIIKDSFILNRCFWSIGTLPLDNEILSRKISITQGVNPRDIYDAVVKVFHAPKLKIFPESYREGHLRDSNKRVQDFAMKRVLVTRFQLTSGALITDESYETIKEYCYMDGLLYHLAMLMHPDTEWFIKKDSLSGFIQSDSKGITSIIAPIRKDIGTSLYEKGIYDYGEEKQSRRNVFENSDKETGETQQDTCFIEVQ